MTGKHRKVDRFNDAGPDAFAWVGRGADGRFARVVGTRGERREALDLPRPAHAAPLTLGTRGRNLRAERIAAMAEGHLFRGERGPVVFDNPLVDTSAIDDAARKLSEVTLVDLERGRDMLKRAWPTFDEVLRGDDEKGGE